MEIEKTLNPQQIENWRNVISMEFGLPGFLIRDKDVINFWKKMKPIPETPIKSTPIFTKCNHSNSITGSKGKYCIDCEKYV